MDSSRTARTLYYFDVDGKWLPFTLRSNGSMESALPDDVVYLKKWSLKNDSVLVSSDLYGIMCRSDTLVLTSTTGESRELIPVGLEQIPAGYRRRQ